VQTFFLVKADKLNIGLEICVNVILGRYSEQVLMQSIGFKYKLLKPSQCAFLASQKQQQQDNRFKI
jgi:hypothetical protein